MIDNDEVHRPDESNSLLQEVYTLALALVNLLISLCLPQAGSNAVVERRIQENIHPIKFSPLLFHDLFFQFFFLNFLFSTNSSATAVCFAYSRQTKGNTRQCSIWYTMAVQGYQSFSTGMTLSVIISSPIHAITHPSLFLFLLMIRCSSHCPFSHRRSFQKLLLNV